MDYPGRSPLGNIAQFIVSILFIGIAAPAFCNDAAQNERTWPKATPESVNMEAGPIITLSQEFQTGKLPYVDSMAVIRCGEDVFDRTYSHDYGKLYYKEAHTKGPLNARLTGIYNYFDPQYHPFYQGSDAHTMQSVTKTVTSVLFGIAMYRGEFHATLNTPILKFFDTSKVKNLDDRKRRITIKDVLTMQAGFDWDEDLPYDNPHNGSSAMEGTDDWIQFVIDRPMAHDPGTYFAYSSGVAELAAYIFQKATGHDIADYAAEHFFKPLGFKHQFWKRTPLGVVDSEGGLYLRREDLAKIGYLYMHDGVWKGQRIVSPEWVKDSTTPHADTRKGVKYGYFWWLIPHGNENRLAWAALGLGGQRLLVVPEDNLMLVFTGWDILEKSTFNNRDVIERIVSGAKPFQCSEIQGLP